MRRLLGKGKWMGVLLLALLAVLVITACGGDKGQTKGLAGSIDVDGSSTVYPITEAMAEEFRNTNPNVMITVGVSGTGGGFKRFVVGETDISDASRPIKDSEKEQAQANGIEWLELPVAYDGITVVVNPQNDWATSMTVDELKNLWEPESKVTRWNQIRPEWPNEKINLYGPGTDSGTFEYFTEEIVGEAKASRSDYTASEDDNTLVQGVSSDKYALGYFGYAYYVENKGKLNVVSVDTGSGPVAPSFETINQGTYKPLSRPVFIYPNKKSLEREEVKAFVKFYMDNAENLVPEVGYVALPANMYQDNLSKLN